MKFKGKDISGMYGTMNHIHPRNVFDHYDSDYMTGLDAIKKTVVNHYSSTELAPGPYKGIVLKVLPEKEKETGILDFLMFWEEDLSLGPRYIIRVPELDSHIPEPNDLESTSGVDLAIIQSHNIYKAASQSIAAELAEVGDIVWVDVKNGEYNYLGKLKDEAGGVQPDGSNGGNNPGDSDVEYPDTMGGTYKPPQYEGFLTNKPAKRGYKDDFYSEYFSKVRARKMAPPSASTTPKLKIVKHQNWDLAAREGLYKRGPRNDKPPPKYKTGSLYIASRLSSMNHKFPEKDPKTGRRRYGKGSASRQDFAEILKNVKHVINGLGGGLYGGSWKAGITQAHKRGPLFSMHSNGTATDMHANTTYNFTYDMNKYEHNLEVQKNGKHWVQWLKMPKEATFNYAGRDWHAKKIRIRAITIPPKGKTRRYKREGLEGIYFNLAECFEWFGVKGIGPIYKNWWNKQRSKGDETWHLDARLTNGYVNRKTTVADGIHAQDFQGGYTTPRKKMKLGIMRYGHAYWTGGAFQSRSQVTPRDPR